MFIADSNFLQMAAAAVQVKHLNKMLQCSIRIDVFTDP
jgi:hypothetical protein